MAYIVSSVTTSVAPASSSGAVVFPDHAVNDLLLAYISQDTGGTNITTASTGWAMLGTGAQSGAVRGQWAWKVATSTTGEDPTFSGANDDWTITAMVVRDAHATEPFGATPTSGTDFIRTDWNAVGKSDSGALTTAVDNCLLLYAWTMDASGGSGIFPRIPPGHAITQVMYNQTAVAHTIGYIQSGSSGAAPTVTMYNNDASEGGNGWVIAVRNKSGGTLQPCTLTGTNVVKWYGNYGVAQETITYVAPSDITSDAVDGVYLSSTTITPTHANVDTTDQPGTYTYFASTENTGASPGKWVGIAHSIPSTDMDGKTLSLFWLPTSVNIAHLGSKGYAILLSDGTNWVAYQLSPWLANLPVGAPSYSQIVVGDATVLASSAGAIDFGAITKIAYVWHRIATDATSRNLGIKNVMLTDSAKLVGGGSAYPVKVNMLPVAYGGAVIKRGADLQGVSQVLVKSKVQIGDGVTPSYFQHSASSLEYPQSYLATSTSRNLWNATDDSVGVTIYASADDVINCSAGLFVTDTKQPFALHASSSTSAAYSFSGTSFVGWDVTWKTGIPCALATFSGCYTIDGKAATFDTCTFTGCKLTSGAYLRLDGGGDGTESGAVSCSFTKGTETYAIELRTVGYYDLTNTTFTGYTNELYVSAASGAIYITLATGQTEPDYVLAGGSTATVDFVQPTVDVAFSPLIAGSQLVVYSAGTTTELFRDNSTGTSETWAEASGAFDYTILKTGYLPIKGSGAAPTSSYTVPSTQTIDRAYAASSGLTMDTNCTANAGTLVFGLTVASTLQNFYAYMIEQWISNSALRNVAFPIVPNGPNSFRFIDWAWDDQDSIDNLSRDGMQYYDSATSTTTDMWAAILSVGVPAGFQVRYQQSDGTGTTNALATGNIDQLVKIYGGSGAVDYTDWLVLKAQGEGYDQAESSVLDIYPVLDDQLFVVGLTPTANGISAASITTGVTVTDHAGSPVTWNSKTYSITITSDRTGEEILQYVRHANDFNWHDLVQASSGSYITVRGKLHGDTGATLKGVRVLTSGAAAHPDFASHMSDEGTAYVVPVLSHAVVSGITAGSRIQVYNVTHLTEVANEIVAGTSWSLAYDDTTDFSADDIVRVRLAWMDGAAAKVPVQYTTIATSAGWSVLAQQEDDEVYNLNAIDGDTVTEFTPDYPNVEIDVSDPDGETTPQRGYAWYISGQMTEAGIAAYHGALTAEDAGNYRINVDAADMHIQNARPDGSPVFITRARLYRSDGSRVTVAGTGPIEMEYGRVFTTTISTSDAVISGTAAEIIAAIPSATANATATLAAAQITPIHSNVKQVNSDDIGGHGIPPTFDASGVMTDPGDPWRPA